METWFYRNNQLQILKKKQKRFLIPQTFPYTFFEAVKDASKKFAHLVS